MEVKWGPLTTHDAPAWAEFAAAVEAVDKTGSHVTVEQTAERLANPLLNLPEGTLAARQGGQIVALGLAPVRQAADPIHLMDLWGAACTPTTAGVDTAGESSTGRSKPHQFCTKGAIPASVSSSTSARL